MKEKYYVISRSRGAIQNRDLNTLASGKSVPAYDIESFNNLEDARKYYRTAFFDDSDYNIYTIINGVWFKYEENYRSLNINFVKNG